MIRQYNPYTEKLLASHRLAGPPEIAAALNRSRNSFREWKDLPPETRTACLRRLAVLLESRQTELAMAMAVEVGKPLSEGLAEVAKSVFTIRYFADRAGEELAGIERPVEGRMYRIQPRPLGGLLLVMPWNFPLWQVIRAGVPSLCLGNVLLLKHAPNAFSFAERLAGFFTEAGFPEGVLVNLKIGIPGLKQVVADSHICGVSLTGSEPAGRSMAALAGRWLKPCVLELGGNDPFLVLEDADLDAAAARAVSSRLINNGQSCVAAKRFLVARSRCQIFSEMILEKLASLPAGDPLLPENRLGPLARKDLLEKLQNQLNRSLTEGARLLTPPGQTKPQTGFFFMPCLLMDAAPGMTCFDEELFGPVFSLTTFGTEEEAIQLANMSRFGLGASVHSADEERARALANRLEAGTVAINNIVRSHPALPFGGIKASGYGRELSEESFSTFANVKVSEDHKTQKKE